MVNLKKKGPPTVHPAGTSIFIPNDIAINPVLVEIHQSGPK